MQKIIIKMKSFVQKINAIYVRNYFYWQFFDWKYLSNQKKMRMILFFFVILFSLTVSRAFLWPLTSHQLYTSTLNIVLWLQGGTVNHEIMMFLKVFGGKCVYVYDWEGKKIRNGVTESPPYNLNQLFDADWPWHLQYGLSLPSTHLQGALQEHTRSVFHSVSLSIVFIAYLSRLFVPLKGSDRRCYIRSTESIRFGVYSVLSQHPQ